MLDEKARGLTPVRNDETAGAIPVESINISFVVGCNGLPSLTTSSLGIKAGKLHANVIFA